MSYKSASRVGKKLWTSWFKYRKQGSYYEGCDRREVERDRQKIRKRIRDEKRWMNRYERREGDRQFRKELEDL